MNGVYPRLVFPDGWDEISEAEVRDRCYCDQVEVEAEDGSRYSVYFAAPDRIEREIAITARQGEPWFAEPGLIVLPEITAESMRTAVRALWKDGFFASSRPVRPGSQ